MDDIEAVVDGLVARGVEFARYSGIEQDGRGIPTAPVGPASPGSSTRAQQPLAGAVPDLTGCGQRTTTTGHLA